MTRPRRRWCSTCSAWIVLDGDAEVFEGTQLVHTRAVCAPIRQGIPSYTPRLR
jgi:hypothetical protein